MAERPEPDSKPMKRARETAAVAAMAVFFLQAPAHCAAKEPEGPVAQYNAGTRQYLKNAFAEAEKSLNESLAAAPGPLQARAAYNLASAQYKQGQASKTPDAGEKFFEQALDNYRMAIRRDPKDRDAQYNYELTQKRLEQAKQQKQEQKQSPQQAKHQETKDQKTQSQQQQGQAGKEEEKSAEASQAQEKQTEEQKDKNEAQAAKPQDNDEKQPEKKSAGLAGEKKEGEQAKELSQQQVLWILDNMQREEFSARANHTQQSVQESNVDQDW